MVLAVKNIRTFFIKTIATFFYVGYLPFVPGTFGSIAGLLLFYLVRNSVITYATVTLIVMFLGFSVIAEAENIFNRKDPRYIVIDEVSGMLLCFLFLPYDSLLVIAGFFLFRLFDTLKPYPLSRIEDLDGAVGVMGDDLLAGLYTNVVLQAAVRLASFKAS